MAHSRKHSESSISRVSHAPASSQPNSSRTGMASWRIISSVSADWPGVTLIRSWA
jgi:hypothetical protein